MPWSALTSASERARTHNSRSSNSTATSSGATPGNRTTTFQPSEVSVNSTSDAPAATTDQATQLGAQRPQLPHRVPALLPAAPPPPAEAAKLLLAHHTSPIRWVAAGGRSELGASRPASRSTPTPEPVDQLTAEPGADAENRHGDHLDGDKCPTGGPGIRVEPDGPHGGEEQDHRDVGARVQQTYPLGAGAGRDRQQVERAGRRSEQAADQADGDVPVRDLAEEIGTTDGVHHVEQHRRGQQRDREHDQHRMDWVTQHLESALHLPASTGRRPAERSRAASASGEAVPPATRHKPRAGHGGIG